MIGPVLKPWDLAAFKQFAVRENWKLLVGTEFFDAFNHPNWGAPRRDLGAGGFGVVTSAADPLIIQFGLKLLFCIDRRGAGG